MPTDVMPIDAFCRLLGERFKLGDAALTPATSFLDDLAFDSLRLLELVLFFEELGVDVPEAMAWDIVTVGDAYEYYRHAVVARPEPTNAAGS